MTDKPKEKKILTPEELAEIEARRERARVHHMKCVASLRGWKNAHMPIKGSEIELHGRTGVVELVFKSTAYMYVAFEDSETLTGVWLGELVPLPPLAAEVIHQRSLKV